MKSNLQLILLCLLVVNHCVACELPPLIPLEDFFRNPTETAHRLSPSGEHLAYLKPWESRLNIHVRKIGQTEVTRATAVTERDIAGFLWVNDDRLVYTPTRRGLRPGEM